MTTDITTIQGKDLIIDVSKLLSDEILYINATKLAKQFGKDLSNYTRTKSYQEYIEAFNSVKITVQEDLSLLKTVHGGKYSGTYIHSDLIVHFLRWLDVEFAVRCDMYIKQKIQQSHNDKITAEATAQANKDNLDWLIMRTEAKATRKSLTNAIKAFCTYAEEQRAESYPAECKYHVLFTKMIYKALDIKKPKGDVNPRDVFNGAVVEKIEYLERLVIKLIYANIKKRVEYHQAFKSIKQSVNDEVA